LKGTKVVAEVSWLRRDKTVENKTVETEDEENDRGVEVFKC